MQVNPNFIRDIEVNKWKINMFKCYMKLGGRYLELHYYSGIFIFCLIAMCFKHITNNICFLNSLEQFQNIQENPVWKHVRKKYV